jgi:CubicO group peptidase (beta-lactamase class C family)
MFDVAARIVQRLTDKRIDEFVREEFFDPLQLKASYHADRIEEKADGSWTRIGMGNAKVTEFPVDREVEISVEVKESGADIVEKGVEVDYGIEKCGEAWGAGRVWMNSDDLVSSIDCWIRPS